MGSFFKGKTTVTKSPFETNPWKEQQGFLTDGFQKGASALDNAMAVNGGDSVANMNGGQLSAIERLQSLGMGAAGNVSNAALTAGMGAIGDLGTYSTNAQSIFDRAGTNRTGDIIAGGTQFADDPFLQGQIDAALGDVRKSFDGTVGGINSAATGTGNINSTRAAALEALALDDAMDRGAAISSQMRGAAYQSGLDRSMAMDAGQTQEMFGANSQIGQSAGMGLDFSRAGLDAGFMGAGASLDASGLLQGQAQAEIDGQRLGDLDLLNRYMQIVGGNYGSEGFTTEVKKSKSPFQQLVGAASSLAGAKFGLPGL